LAASDDFNSPFWRQYMHAQAAFSTSRRRPLKELRQWNS
jgi:hypothetical protein